MINEITHKIAVLFFALEAACDRFWKMPAHPLPPPLRPVTAKAMVDAFCKICITIPVFVVRGLLAVLVFLYALKLSVPPTAKVIFGHPPQSWLELVTVVLLCSCFFACLLRGARLLDSSTPRS